MIKQARALVMGAAFALVLATTAVCQEGPLAGRVVGKVVDEETGEPLIGAQIALAGTDRGVLSGVGGRFILLNVPSGTHALSVTYIGYGTKTVEGIAVPPDGAVVQNISLASQAIQVQGVTVSAARELGTVTAALTEQRTAVGVISGTTQAQIARSPDSDAAQAVKRVSGVTVQDGKYVFVRGLGERYTTTALNGARVPSPEPEKKVVPLDLFPSALLDAITTSKTFTPDQPGDFSGAQVNLRTRSFPARGMVQLSLTGGYNSLATGKSVLVPPTSGGDWLAMSAGTRELPTSLTGITDFTNLTQTDVNQLIRSLPDQWSYKSSSGAPNTSGSLALGGEQSVLGQRFGYIGSLSYSRSQEVHDGEVRSQAVPADAQGTPKSYNPFLGSTGQTSVLWGGLLNLSTVIGRNHEIRLDNTYNRTADNSAHMDWGTLEEFQQVDSVRRTSITYVERTVRSSQLSGTDQFGDDNKVSWSLSSSAVTRDEPDRADLAYGYEFAPTGERLDLAWLGFIPEAAKRTTSSLSEDALSGSAEYARSFGQAAGRTTIKIGGAYRHTTRDARSASYNLRALGLGPDQRAASPEAIFDGTYTQGSTAAITIEPNISGGTYHANDDVSAGYLMAEVPLGSRIRVIGGARLEQWNLDLEAEPVSSAPVTVTRRNTDVLPSLAVNVQLTDAQALRLSATQTLSRPEYREMAPISYRDMLGEREVFGDSSLVRSLVQNYDARWEWYPTLDEVLSLGVFAKRFDKPIEQIDVATSGVSQLSYVNARSAFNYGAELELRKNLGFVGAFLRPFGFFSNITLMKSTIDTGNSSLSALTNDKRPMVGQAPYVVNAGVSYTHGAGGTSATLLYNVVGRRITSTAVTPLSEDTYEQPRQQLDFSLRFAVRGGIDAKIDATNLLDAPYEELQGDVVRYRYDTGRALSFGMSWQVR